MKTLVKEKRIKLTIAVFKALIEYLKKKKKQYKTYKDMGTSIKILIMDLEDEIKTLQK